MTAEPDEWVQLERIVVECALEQFRTIDPPLAALPALVTPDDPPAQAETAAIVGFAGESQRGNLVLKVSSGLLVQARSVPAVDDHQRLAELASELLERIRARARGLGLDFRAGWPRVLSGTRLKVGPAVGAVGGQIRLASAAGKVDVWLEVSSVAGGTLIRRRDILVIDDSPAIRQEVRELLGASGYGVVEAGDGLEALARLAENTDLAMVFCDVNMPNMDGLAFLGKAKEAGLISDLPVVMITSEIKSKLCNEALKRGAAGWIVKPFSSRQVMATVQKLARR
jgi:two-component system, chemotaxis family, chemotaxis protein CheY